MRAVICVPWRGGSPTREHLWDIARSRFQSTGLDVFTGDSDPDQPFCISEARNAAAAVAGPADVYVFLDADVYIPHTQLILAIEFAYRNEGSALPFSRMLSMDPTNGLTRERTQLGNVRYVTSGCVAVSRQVWEQVHWDERIRGYGWEDGAFLKVVSNIAPFAIIPGSMVSYEHARTADETPEVALANRPERLLDYDAAGSDPDALRAVARATIEPIARMGNLSE